MDVDYLYIQINFRTYNWIPRRLFHTDSEWGALVAQIEEFGHKACRQKPFSVSMNPQAVASPAGEASGYMVGESTVKQLER